MNTYININGRIIKPPATLPSRDYRDTWELDGKGGVTINAAKQREIFIEKVKAEAKRRIFALASEDKQRNVTARGVELMPKRIAGTLTAEEQVEWDAGEALWAAIKVIRARSDVLEQGPILDDVTLDSHWV